MKNEIFKNLKNIEKENGIKILFACESGSRAWGFPSPDSDYDIRFIYVHKLDWYLNLKPQKDTIELMLPNDLDISGWELRKALNLFGDSNFSIFEWLNSPIVYVKNETFFKELSNLKDEYFSPIKISHSYFSLAKKHIQKYFNEDEVKIKKVLYVLRTLLACQWILRYNTMPPTHFEEIYKNKEICNLELSKESNELIKSKKSLNELDSIKLSGEIKRFIDNSMKSLECKLNKIKLKKANSLENLNNLFRKNLR